MPGERLHLSRVQLEKVAGYRQMSKTSLTGAVRQQSNPHFRLGRALFDLRHQDTIGCQEEDR